MMLKWTERAAKVASEVARVSVVALALSLVALPAVAGSMYTWETEDGTSAFTDDPKRIPAMYKDKAVKKTMGKLKDYSRLTPAEPPSGPSYEERIQARLAELRDRDERHSEAEMLAAHHGMGRGPMLQVGPLLVPIGQSLRQQPYEPIVADQVTVNDGRHNTTKTIRVIRQGDRVIYAERPQYSDWLTGRVQREQDVIGTAHR